MVAIPAIAGWMTLLYPDLTFTNDMCRPYAKQGGLERKDGQELLESIMTTSPDRIIIKSRVLDFFVSIKKKSN